MKALSLRQPWDVLKPTPLVSLESWRIPNQYGFVLEEATALPFTRCERGALGFWSAPPEVERLATSHFGDQKTQP